MPSPAPQPRAGRRVRIPVQTCLPPMPQFFPPHQADPVRADAAERKVTTWQVSGVCSSCTTGMSFVTTQSRLPDLHTKPWPHPTWVVPATWGRVQEGRGRVFFLPNPAAASVGVGRKQTGGIGGPPLPLPPPGAPGKSAGPAGAPASASANWDDPLGPSVPGVLLGVASGTGWRGFEGWVLCHGSKSLNASRSWAPWRTLGTS